MTVYPELQFLRKCSTSISSLNQVCEPKNEDPGARNGRLKKLASYFYNTISPEIHFNRTRMLVTKHPHNVCDGVSGEIPYH